MHSLINFLALKKQVKWLLVLIISQVVLCIPIVTAYLSVKWDCGSQEVTLEEKGWLGWNTPLKVDKVQNPYQMPEGLQVDTDIFMYKGQHIKKGDEIDVYLWELLIRFNARAFILLCCM